MSLLIGLGDKFDLKDPLGLYKDRAFGLEPPKPKAAEQPVKAPAGDPSLPAGMRNNNPGNIKYRQDVPWEGLVGPSQNTDQGDPQAVFETPELGMRAAYKLARNKYDRGQKTAMDIIAGAGGWTPGNTQAAANVARTMGLDPNEDLRLDDPGQASKFLRALVTQEHGSASSAYTDDMIAGTVDRTSSEMNGAVGALNKLAGGGNLTKFGGAPEGLPATATPGQVARGSDGQTYQYVETRGMDGASGDFGWIRYNGGGSNASAGAPDSLASGKAPPATDWLSYANQTATRNQHLSPKLVDALAFLPDMGVTMQVFSGGQDATGARRTGSHRHDHGGAADVFFYKDGRQLSWQNPKDIPVFQEIVERAKANGVTGFGAGDGYMRPGSMHIGFGAPAVWGAGGRGTNAPDWLRQAFASDGKYPSTGSRSDVQRGSIVADAAFKPSDPLGLYRGADNPLMPKPMELRPFHPDERRDNGDGTYSTEISTTWQLPDGKWVNVPSLWMGKDGPKQFDASDEDGILGAMQRWEAKSGQQFPRFASMEEAEAAAQARSAAGGAGAGQQASPSPVEQIFQGLNAKEPGRYKLINADQMENWRADWEKNQSGQFMKGLKGSLIDQNPELAGNALEAVSVLTDQPTLKDWGDTVRQWGQKNSYKRIPRVGSISNIRTDGVRNFLSDAMDYAAYSLGQGIGSMAPGLALGVGTAAVTANPVAGFIAGESGPSYIQNLGDIYGSLRDDPEIAKRVASGELSQKQVATWAAAAAVPMAALDTFSAGKAIDIAGGDKVKSAVVKRIAKGLVEGTLTEGGTEGLQEVISQSVQAALGSDKPLADRAISVADNAIGGALAGGAIGGASRVRGGSDVAEETPAPSPEEQAPPAPVQAAPATPQPSGPISKALLEGQRRAAAARGIDVGQPAQPTRFVVNDGPIDGSPAGELDGQTVTLAPDQSKVPTNMRRVVTRDGSERIVGNQLLEQQPAAPAAAPAAPAAPSLPAPREIADHPVADTAGGAFQKGTTVRVDADGIPPFMATVENIEGDEAVVFDSSSGEVYQIPTTSLTPIAAPPSVQAAPEVGKVPASEPAPTVITRGMRDRLGQLGYDNKAIRGMTPETASNILRAADKGFEPDATDPAMAPAEPRAADRTSELPPASEEKPASAAFPGPPAPGQRVIVNAPGVDRFAGRVERYEDVDGATEAVVVDDNGTTMQVPLENLKVSAKTAKQVEADELKRNPPVEREPAPKNASTDRAVSGHTVVMPDEQHARLFDLGKLRLESKMTLGASKLDMDSVSPAAQQRLADGFGISFEAAGQMADDYRYRVERAGKQARSQLPVKMHGVNETRLKQWQNEARKAAGTEPSADGADWWHGELTPAGRRQVLEQAGIKRSEKTSWRHLPKGIQDNLLAVRDEQTGAQAPKRKLTEMLAPADLSADVGNMMDAAAHEAATSPRNETPEPSQAQKEAGNYKLGHVNLAGLDISIENPEGSTRSGVSGNGTPWSNTMKSHYGYIRGTVGRDKDHVDVFVNPRRITAPSGTSPVYVVDQNDAKGDFDEHKVMLGYGSADEAREAYLENYSKGWKGLGALNETTLDDFKRWLREGDTSRPFAKRGVKVPPEARKPESQKSGKPERRTAKRNVSSTTSEPVVDNKKAAPKEEKAVDAEALRAEMQRASERSAKPSSKARIVQNILGAKPGDVVTVSGALDAAEEGHPYRLDAVDRSGDVRVVDPETGTATTWPFVDILRARNAGAKFEVAASDQSDQGDLRFSVGEDFGVAPGFYSAALRAFENASLAKGSPSQWLGFLRNQRGVKPEEVKWLGLEDWLKAQDGPVRREAVAQFIRANQIGVREVLHGSSSGEKPVYATPEEAIAAIARTFGRSNEEVEEHWGYKDKADYITLADSIWEEKDGTQYGQYQLPGGENYHELLLTLPAPAEALERYEVRPGQNDGEWTVFDTQEDDVVTAPGLPSDDRERAESAAYHMNHPPASTFKSAHFDVPNVLAHVRFNDRIDAANRRTLFLEEVQSDWHQAGRKAGYRNPPKLEERERQALITERAELAARAVMLDQAAREQARSGASHDYWEATRVALEENGWRTAMDRITEINDRLGEHQGGVPDAPFKTTWPDLVLKRMIRWAAEHGYEQIAWTPGEVQASRYDLSQSISRVVLVETSSGVSVPPAGPFGSGMLEAYDHDGDVVLEKYVREPKDIASIVGKDTAEKLLAQVGRAGRSAGLGARVRELSGLELKVGGEGMQAFYDRILVNTANALGNRFGAHVHKTSVPAGDSGYYTVTDRHGHTFTTDARGADQALLGDLRADIQPIPRPVEVFALPITGAMRNAAMDGQPLFSMSDAAARDTHTVETLEAELRAGPVGGLIGSLQKRGMLSIGTGRDAKMPFALAHADSAGRIFMAADRIRRGQGTAILLHEAFHSGRDRLFAGKPWAVLMQHLERLYKQFDGSTGAAKTFFDEARRRERRARDVQGPMLPAKRIEEFGAYTIEEYEKAPAAAKRWVDDLLGTFKAWMLRRFGRQFGHVTPAELRALAVAALRDQAPLSRGAKADRRASVPDIRLATGAEASIPEEPVARLSGDELGVEFHGPEDMPALRKAAQRWYDANLRGITATTAAGEDVTFNQRGRNKTVSGGKGDTLLRSVPAIRAIIERGTEVLRVPGDRPAVIERIVIAAPVTLGGVVQNLAVSIHRTTGGHLHYDFTFDNGERVGGPGIGARLAGDASIADSLESAANSARGPGDGVPGEATKNTSLGRSAGKSASSGINLFFWPEENKAPAGWDTVDAMDATELSDADRQEIRDIVRTVSGLNDVTFTRRIELPNGAPGWGTDTPTTAGGFYDPAADAITIALDSGSGHVAYHEAFHRLQRLFLSSQEKAVLAAEKGRLRSMVAGRMGREAQASRMSQKELEAEAFAIYSAGTGKIKPHVVLRAAWDRIAKMVRQVRNFLAGRGFQTAEDVFDRAAAGKLNTRPAGSADAAGGAQYSLTENRAVDEIRGKLTDLQPKMLAAVPLNYFSELARPNMTAVDEYLRVRRKLDAYRGKKHAEADEIAQTWLKFARLGFGKDGKAKAAALADLMHEATLAGVDPSKTDDESRAHPDYERLRRAFITLPPTGRNLFIKARDAYKAQAAEMDQILLDNVRKAQEIAQRQAEKQFREELVRIEASKLSPQAKKDARLEAEQNYKAQSTKAQWSMKARLTKMRIAFEASRVEEPYFPLARFGRYFVTVRDVDGTVLSFSRRERAADRDRLAADMRKAFPGRTVEIGVTENGAEIRQAMDPRIIAEIETIIGGAGLDSSTMTTVLDQIWQRYLATMPDLSTRKRFIHRKGTAGFDADALRAFSSHMFHAAHQMGRLKYGLEMQELVSNAADQARESDDVTRAMTLANELKARHKWVMNPTGSSAVQAVTSAMFVWHLGATPAAAIVNLTQTPMLGIPILAARFGSFAKASAALTKASIDLVRGLGSMDRTDLSVEDRKALEAFYETGLIDRTQSHDLAGVGETGVDYSPLRARVMAAVSWAFHRTEVINREVTALAAYRLARSAGQNVMDAIDTAHDLTWKTHFDYANANRPRVLQGDAAKLLFVFQNYQLNMWYRLFRDIHQSFKGETPQAKREARYQAAGIIGMMTLMGGVTGMFGYTAMMALAGALFGDDDDPFAFRDQVERDIVDLFGPDIGDMILKGVPGHLARVDLTSRIGMPDFFIRAPDADLDGRDWMKELLVGLWGATGSTLVNMGDAYQQISDGKTFRGVEMAAPKFAKDLLKTYRYLNEGVLTRKGDPVVERDRLDPWDYIAQAVGFTPAKIAETYDRNSALRTAEGAVMDERRELMNRYALAYRLGDDDARADAIAAIKKFNRVPMHRAVAITADSLRQSLKARIRNATKQEDGLLIQNERLGHDLRSKLPERSY